MLALFFQASRSPNSVFYWSILAHLPFAFEPVNRQAKTDDFPDLVCDVVLRCVARRPGDSTALLMPASEMRDMLACMYWIIDELKRSVGVNGNVIPGWHYFAGLSLGRVPGWCDIGIRSQKDGQRIANRSSCLRVRAS